MTTDKGKVREPAVAGMFYPDNGDELRDEVRSYLSGVTSPGPPDEVKVRGLIAPHAGYVYSGQTAAHAYNAVREKKYDAVVVVGPSHREQFRGVSVYPGAAYRTPLGDIPIHAELRDALVSGEDIIRLSERGHRQEHSIEVQLPFLQVVLGRFRFLPLVMGEQSRESIEKLSLKLEEAGKGADVLMIASSDLSHYHTYETAVELDGRVTGLVERFDHDGLMNDLENRNAEACGGGPMAAVMRGLNMLGCSKAKVLYKCNSGDISGDKSAVVGYMAAVFH